MSGLGKLARGLVGLLVVVMLLVVVNSWWHEYRNASTFAKQEATSTPTATPAPVAQKTVVVLTDGLNLRDKPDATGTTIRGLKHGEQYVLVGQIGPAASPTWLQLRDAKGQLGWVTNNPQYLRVQK